MATEKKRVRTLTIYLVKPTLFLPNEIISEGLCRPPIDIAIAGADEAKLYIKKTPATRPRWAELFESAVDPKTIDEWKTPGVAAVLFMAVSGRRFAVVFGPAGRFLLQDDVWEDRFGLIAALNSVDSKSFRCVDVQSLDAIQSQTRIQAGQKASPEEFGLNIEQDMLKAIVGTPTDPILGNRMTGADALTVSVKMLLDDLPALLLAYLAKFEQPLNSADHDWVNNITPVKGTALIAQLETELEAKLLTGSLDDIWLAIPEIINWSSVEGFLFSGASKDLHTDISLTGFIKTLKGAPLTLKALRSRRVQTANAEFVPLANSWPVFKCLYAEVDHGGTKYILNDAKWYGVASDFVAKTSAEYAKIERSALKLPDYTGHGEGAYNAAVHAGAPNQYALLDAKVIMHGGGHGKIEVCDLLSADRRLIHVKHYSKSSVLSHLFAQGFVSGQLLRIDSEFRGKVNAALLPPFNALIRSDKEFERGEFTVVYAVISNSPGDDLRIPFLSQVNLNNTAKVLGGHGYSVELLKVRWNPTLTTSKTKPPTKKTKSIAPAVPGKVGVVAA